jgi:hypothetical protein
MKDAGLGKKVICQLFDPVPGGPIFLAASQERAPPKVGNVMPERARQAPPQLDRPMRPMAMAHDTVAAVRQFQILPHGDKGISFDDQHLSRYRLRRRTPLGEYKLLFFFSQRRHTVM